MAIPALRFTALERPRLAPPALDGGAPAPLTLLFAPAGMGKTVLAAQWVRGGALDGFDTYWVSASEAESDEARFWLLCREALDPESEGRAYEGRASEEVKAEVRRLLARLRRPTMLVIDGFERLSNSRLDLDLAALLGLSEHLHLVVLSRRFAALDGPLVTSQVPVAQLVASDLAFTLDEVGELGALSGVDDAAFLQRLHAGTNGWPIAVRLLLNRVADQRELDRRIARFVADRTETLASPRARRALLVIALCDQVSSDMLSEELRASYAETESLARELREIGLIEQRWYSDTIRYTVHPGLSRPLSAQAAQQFGVSRSRELQRRHALDLGRDDPSPAVLLLLRLGHLEDASRMVARNFLEVVDEPGLLDALRQIPVEDMRETAALLGARLILEIPVLSTPREELDLLHQTLRIYARDGLLRDDGELRILSHALLVAAERMRGNGDEALRLARDLEQRLRSESESTMLLLRRSLSVVHANIALTGALAGDLALAERGFTRTLRCAEEQGDFSEQIRAWNGLALVAAMRGEMTRVRGHLDRAEALGRQSGRRSPQQSWVNGAAASMFVSLESGEMERVRASAKEIGPILTRAEQWPILVMIEAAESRVRNGNAEALALIRRRTSEAESVFRTPVFFRGVLAVYTANLTAMLGDYSGAARMLAELPEAHPEAVVATARIRALAGDLAGAAGIARPALEAGLPPRLGAELGMILAAVEWRRGAAEAAVEAFASAAATMRENGLRSPVTMAPHDDLLAVAGHAAAAGEPGAAEAVSLLESLEETERCVRFEALTPAELRTLEVLGTTGGTVAAIASILFITQNTVKFHLRSIYRKLRVANREDAVQRARGMGLLG
ncbi:MAG: LuxR C-terminal-related transcriptional regulator [Leucobacter sp.]